MGPSPPTRLRMQRCMAEAVEPRPVGDTSRTITAAGARQHSLHTGGGAVCVGGGILFVGLLGLESDDELVSQRHLMRAARPSFCPILGLPLPPSCSAAHLSAKPTSSAANDCL